VIAPRTIELAHGGTHLIAAIQGGGLDIFHRDVRGDPPVRVPCPELAAFLSIGGELWVAAGDAPRLARHALDDGRLLGAPHALPPASHGRLVRGLGTSLAMWIGAELQVPLAADRAGGVLAGAPIAGADLALPLSRTRALVCSRGGVALREGASTRWSIPGGGDGRVSHGAILSDGRAAALVVERAAEHTLLVIGLRDGSLQHRIALHDVDGVHFAARRMLAVVLAARRQLVLIDLRFGRIIGDQAVERDVCSLAIDDTGQEIALRYDEPYGELVTISVDQLASLPQLGTSSVRRAAIQISPHAAERAAPAPIDEASASEPTPDPAADTAAPIGPPTDEPALDAEVARPRAPALRPMAGLAPRRACAAATTAETHAVLAAQRDLAIAWTALAIARGWDRGRIAHAESSAMPFRNEVEGIVGTLCGLAPDDVAEAERRVTAAEAALQQAHASAAPRLPPLAALADELGLSALERDLLLVIAAPSLWGEVARLYGIVANDENRPLCDEHLVATIFADRASPYDIAVALDADAALSRFGLVRTGPGTGRPFLPLSVDRIALVVLRGSPPYGELAPAIRRFDGVVRPLDQLRIRAGVAHRLADDLARASNPLRIVVRGRIGAGRRTLLATIAAAAGRELAVIDTPAMLREPRTRAAELRVALQRAHICGLLPCIDGIDRIPSDDVIGREQIRDVLRGHPGALALRVAWDATPPIDPGHVLVDLPAPNGSERVAAWTASIADAGLRVESVSELADRYAVGPGVIERVCARVAAARPDAGAAADTAMQLDEAVRQHLESRLGTVAHRIAHLATWSQVVLPPDIQDSLTELLARIRRRRIVFEAWGFDRVMSTSRGVTALFQGGPGTGKTLVASAIANELGMDLYRVDLSRVMSKWIGETEQNLAKLFDVAEDGNAIILFDEADSLFAKRTEVRSSVDRYANIEVNYLLQRLDSFEGIAILTTNFASSIDTAFKRRLSLRLTFPFPDEDQRERLWRAHLPPEAPVAAGLDLAELARRYRLSGGYIRNCTLRAAFLAAEEGRPLSSDHLQRAIRAEFREIGKLGDGGLLE
jgi:hypothetical protein